MKKGREAILTDDLFKRFAPFFNFEKDAEQIRDYLVKVGYATKESNNVTILDWDKVPE